MSDGWLWMGAGALGRGIDAGQNLAHRRAVRLGVRDLPRQRGHQRRLTLGRRSRFQRVEIVGHCIILGLQLLLI